MVIYPGLLFVPCVPACTRAPASIYVFRLPCNLSWIGNRNPGGSELRILRSSCNLVRVGISSELKSGCLSYIILTEDYHSNIRSRILSELESVRIRVIILIINVRVPNLMPYTPANIPYAPAYSPAYRPGCRACKLKCRAIGRSISAYRLGCRA